MLLFTCCNAYYRPPNNVNILVKNKAINKTVFEYVTQIYNCVFKLRKFNYHRQYFHVFIKTSSELSSCSHVQEKYHLTYKTRLGQLHQHPEIFRASKQRPDFFFCVNVTYKISLYGSAETMNFRQHFLLRRNITLLRWARYNKKIQKNVRTGENRAENFRRRPKCSRRYSDEIVSEIMLIRQQQQVTDNLCQQCAQTPSL